MNFKVFDFDLYVVAGFPSAKRYRVKPTMNGTNASKQTIKTVEKFGVNMNFNNRFEIGL